MTRPVPLQVTPGKGLGFLSLGASLHDTLTRLKAQPHIYPIIDVSYSPSKPLLVPVVLNLPHNGLRLRFDGPGQRLRLIEVLDFTKTQLIYKSIDLFKIPENRATQEVGSPSRSANGPTFRHVYNRLMGPTFPGEYIPPATESKSAVGLYVLSYPGVAFSFPLQTSAWSPKIDFVSLLSSTAVAPAKSLAIFDGSSWQDARQDLMTRPCLDPKPLALSGRSKENRPDEIDLIKIFGRGNIEMVRRSSPSFHLNLSETSPQDLVAELGPPDAIYRKNDRRLSIHKTHERDHRPYQNLYKGSPGKYDDSTDTDQSSVNNGTDDSDLEDESAAVDEESDGLSAECFYNYFHHGFDVFISYPSSTSPSFPGSQPDDDFPVRGKSTDHLVATKILLHANVPGSYPFNRYRRSRWVIDVGESQDAHVSLDSETPFAVLSNSLRRIWHDSYASEDEEKSFQRGMVLNRGWGDSPGSSCELLGGWEDSAETPKKGSTSNGGPGFGNTELFGFPGLVFEVLKNDAVSCLTVY
ncbi:hypothetical protein MMC12_001403 [Toensbergia leucococca]|nr:hypothetical protein [Toensbergia leucococca]